MKWFLNYTKKEMKHSRDFESELCSSIMGAELEPQAPKGRFGLLCAFAGRDGGENGVACVGGVAVCRPISGADGCSRKAIC